MTRPFVGILFCALVSPALGQYTEGVVLSWDATASTDAVQNLWIQAKAASTADKDVTLIVEVGAANIGAATTLDVIAENKDAEYDEYTASCSQDSGSSVVQLNCDTFVSDPDVVIKGGSNVVMNFGKVIVKGALDGTNQLDGTTLEEFDSAEYIKDVTIAGKVVGTEYRLDFKFTNVGNLADGDIVQFLWLKDAKAAEDAFGAAADWTFYGEGASKVADTLTDTLKNTETGTKYIGTSKVFHELALELKADATAGDHHFTAVLSDKCKWKVLKDSTFFVVAKDGTGRTHHSNGSFTTTDTTVVPPTEAECKKKDSAARFAHLSIAPFLGALIGIWQ